ncbi:MAG: type II toxin-antitoxin system MqsR family toxin [Sulfuricurvum sp.]
MSPTYHLDTIKALIHQNKYRITMVASNGAITMGMNDADILQAVILLSANHFYKTMPSEKIASLWQDVYHIRYKGYTVYLKLQITDNAIVISFKEK